MYIWWSERDKQQDNRVTKNTTVLESERHLKMRHCRPARETPETQLTKIRDTMTDKRDRIIKEQIKNNSQNGINH